MNFQAAIQDPRKGIGGNPTDITFACIIVELVITQSMANDCFVRGTGKTYSSFVV